MEVKRTRGTEKFSSSGTYKLLSVPYLLTYLLTYLLITYSLTYLVTYSLHGAGYYLKSR